MKKVLAAVFALGAALASARTRESFNDGWEFAREGEDFRPVRVPHDWAIAGPFDDALKPDTGLLPWKGRGVYRKTFVLDALPQGRFFLDFDGVMARATVLVNGSPCGRGEYGYLGFRADATSYVIAGTNTVEVRCDTRDFVSRWYPGAGMYRNTWIVRTDAVHLLDDSLRIETRDVLTSLATLKVECEVANGMSARQPVTVGVRLVDPRGGEVASDDEREEIDAYANGDFDLELKVKHPRLWRLERDAARYALIVEARVGARVVDRLVRQIGFREFRFDPDGGFVLNGVRTQLRGVNLHSDLGPLGMAFDEGAARRQLTILRDMGANAVRTSHNCPAPEFLDLCDEMGFFVWDECFDKWNASCGRIDEPLEEYVPRILKAFVRRDRNHPSVFVWSMGNEIFPADPVPPAEECWWSGSPAFGTTAERCARFRLAMREEDETRPVGIGCCYPEAIARGDYAALDITGWNYRRQYALMKRAYPAKSVLYSESASAVSEFGYYSPRVPTNKTDYAVGELRVDSRDRTAAEWSDIPDREFYLMEQDRYVGGEFVWTGIDYLGEPTPYCGAGARSSYFGILDLCVLPKDRFYLYRAHWNKDAFTLHLVPHHWNFPAGTRTPVFAYTSADEAELFLNGRSLGRRRKDPTAGNYEDYYSVLPRERLVWDDVAWEAGELKVVAYGKDGAALGTQILRTAGEPVRIVLEEDGCYPNSRGEYLSVVKVTLQDKDGNFVPNDSRRVTFAAEGCEIAAVGNSDPLGRESFTATSSHPLCFGRAAVYLRYACASSPKLKATAAGLESAELEIRVRRGS